MLEINGTESASSPSIPVVETDTTDQSLTTTRSSNCSGERMALASTDTVQYGNRGRDERGEFARQLSALHQDAGAPSLRHVAKLAQQRARNADGGGRLVLATAQRISDWMNGRNVPARFESLVPVLHVLVARARRRAGTPRETVSLQAWRSLWVAARRAPAAASDTTTEPPYPNDDGFSEGKEPAFFGRQRAIGSILEMVRASASSKRAADVIVLTGASGIGKTTLLQAGVIPALSAESMQWGVVVTTPGRNPFSSLARIFCATDCFITSEPDLDAVRRWAGDRRLLLIIDQFEQLYRPDVDATVREAFLTWLKQVSTIGSVLVAVRSDQLASCSQDPWLVHAVQDNSLTLHPPDRQELMAAIVGPPHTRGVTVDPAAAELLITELAGNRPSSDDPAAGAGVLPLLSATMRSMWAGLSGRRLELAAYHRVGGVAGVVGRIAEETWEALTSAEQLDARHILLALVTVHRDGTVTRFRTSTAELARVAARTSTGPDLVHRLVQARLITLESEYACLVHDAVLKWDRLCGWIAEHRSQLIWRQRIEDDAAEWEAAHRDPGLLYRSIRLTTAIRHADPTTSTLATTFLRASARAELAASPSQLLPELEYPRTARQ
ncbi:NACHT domain-containing protein [Nocardia sp. CA-129566]|uniref:nSTAND1 domain-containing NTPase n=1 Tax=Nocardia sp. CA-129566 TaxID=3239976 RepID=UPI003D983BEE